MPRDPTEATGAPVDCPDWAYTNRHLVENLWARLMDGAPSLPAMRGPPAPYLGLLCLAAAAWLRA
ncbi:hypothetical protein GCM10011504_00020 [Siccirubricoccus deserti]|nr:hypothetical protein GCM10011504_00020 [Siccirubricoccus deserti]